MSQFRDVLIEEACDSVSILDYDLFQTWIFNRAFQQFYSHSESMKYKMFRRRVDIEAEYLIWDFATIR